MEGEEQEGTTEESTIDEDVDVAVAVLDDVISSENEEADSFSRDSN